MKKVTLLSASLLLAVSGCGIGQGPNIFTRLHNRIHGVSNVGAPCAACDAPVHHGCETCGTNAAAGYGGYDGTVIDSYDETPIVSTVPSAAPISYNGTTNPPIYNNVQPNVRNYASEGVISKPSR